ncbi:MAG: hypothetical protein PW789_07415 [Edaphobacter sp.]|uniref:hypothetical protein n=1 Tax=Edaphobacter sp. TaxID=1934404 RepID=UPI0023962C79|nr:hypothetical protein [Edaphobacter sp.]MDE1176423.1 hypothetical protein [Edaphobacter sp.]
MASPERPANNSHATELQTERIRQIRGLFLLAIAAIVFAIWRAGLHRAFTPGWWRLW